jgi:hypothetical protein
MLASPGKNARHYLKNKLKAKGLGVVDQVIECLPCKHEALNSILNVAKN